MATTIDSAWLSANGPAPYILNSASETYNLTVDVTEDGTAFVIAADGITFDLGGNTITYGNRTQPVVANGGFETGSGASVPNWDLTGAGSAVIAANPSLGVTNYLFGAQSLKFANLNGTERVVSDPFTIPVANHTYVACVFFHNNTVAGSIKIEIWDDITNTKLAEHASDSFQFQKNAPNVHFTPTTTNNLRIEIEVSATNQDVWIDGVECMLTYDYGVLCSDTFSGSLSGYANLSAAAQAAYRGVWDDIVLQNGNVVMGQRQVGTPLEFSELIGSCTINNITLTRRGVDGNGIVTNRTGELSGTGNVTVTNCTINEAEITGIFKRTVLRSSMALVDTDGNLTVTGNALNSSRHVGILWNTRKGNKTATISGNSIYPDILATNGYGILIQRKNEAKTRITANTIDATSGGGRGILVEAGNQANAPIRNVEIDNNTVTVREHAERENLGNTIATAFRLRDSAPQNNILWQITVHDNSFTSICPAGGGWHEAGAGRISFPNTTGKNDRAGSRFWGNTWSAITHDAAKNAKCLVFQNHPNQFITFTDETIDTNHIGIEHGDAIGEASGAQEDYSLIDCVLTKSTDGAVKTYVPMKIGVGTATFDSVGQYGITYPATYDQDDITWIGTGNPKRLYHGHVVTVTVTDSATGEPVAGAICLMADKNGTTIGAVETDAQGIAKTYALQTIYSQTTATPTPDTTESMNPHTLVITHPAYTTSSEGSLTITGPTSLSRTLTASGATQYAKVAA